MKIKIEKTFQRQYPSQGFIIIETSSLTDKSFFSSYFDINW